MSGTKYVVRFAGDIIGAKNRLRCLNIAGAAVPSREQIFSCIDTRNEIDCTCAYGIRKIIHFTAGRNAPTEGKALIIQSGAYIFLFHLHSLLSDNISSGGITVLHHCDQKLK